jgi:hypothetical protein
MNRKERRAAASRQRKHFDVPLNDIYKRFDITVEGKELNSDGAEMPMPLVMIMANTKGRKITEDLWPDVEWARDPVFSRNLPEDWQFTHIRVTQLPQHLQAVSAPEDAAGDSLAFAVAHALQSFAEPRRVAHYTGFLEDLRINLYNPGEHGKSSAREIEVEYMSPTFTAAGTA